MSSPSPAVLPLLGQDLDAYARWTVDIWMGDEHHLTERDFTIMGLGLGGEMGEVAEVVCALETAPVIDRVQATKEMGDVLYYWARVCAAFDISAHGTLGRAWSRQHPARPIPAQFDELARGFAKPSPPGSPTSTALDCLFAQARLSTQLGSVQEIMKKRVRDTHLDPARLDLALSHAIAAWCRLCLALGLVPSQVALANHAKIEDRKARGTMRGNGNDR